MNSFIKSAFDLQLQSEIAVSSLCTATHFLECLDLGTKLTNLDSLCDYWPHILVSISFAGLAHYYSGKIPISREMSSMDWPQVFLSVIFKKVYISFNSRHNSYTLPTDTSPYRNLKLISAHSFPERGEVSILRFFFLQIRTLSSLPIIIFHRENHTLPVV